MPIVVMNVFVEHGMNERIKEIAVQAGVTVLTTHGIKDVVDGCYIIGPAHLQKFAELIVRECINKIRSRQMFAIQDEHNSHHAFDLLVYDLESHFGVEE